MIGKIIGEPLVNDLPVSRRVIRLIERPFIRSETKPLQAVENCVDIRLS
jgi:hypothetical protein